jgi:hypothetical protein
MPGDAPCENTLCQSCARAGGGDELLCGQACPCPSCPAPITHNNCHNVRTIRHPHARCIVEQRHGPLWCQPLACCVICSWLCIDACWPHPCAKKVPTVFGGRLVTGLCAPRRLCQPPACPVFCLACLTSREPGHARTQESVPKRAMPTICPL